jgi:hypothetical protein
MDAGDVEPGGLRPPGIVDVAGASAGAEIEEVEVEVEVGAGAARRAWVVADATVLF